LALWREPQLRRQLDALTSAEAQIKTTGMPAETACRAALLALAQEARA